VTEPHGVERNVTEEFTIVSSDGERLRLRRRFTTSSVENQTERKWPTQYLVLNEPGEPSPVEVLEEGRYRIRGKVYARLP
jgi:hypothetical protein